MVYSHKGLALKYAQAWYSLDITVLENIVDDHVVYKSEWLTGLIEGRSEVLDYLGEKFLAIRNGTCPVKAEIGVYNNEPCVVLSQKHAEPHPYPTYKSTVDSEGNQHTETIIKYEEGVEFVITFEFSDNQISKIHTCGLILMDEVEKSVLSQSIFADDIADIQDRKDEIAEEQTNDFINTDLPT
ncbi:MAG: hypothetical protein ACOYN5_01420 [Bacteroidales bacterium]